MTDKHFETPKQFQEPHQTTHKRSNSPAKLTQPRWYEWDDQAKPMAPAQVKLSLLEARKWAVIELTQAGMPEADAKDNVDFLLTGALNINYGYLRANFSRQMPAALAAVLAKWVAQLSQNEIHPNIFSVMRRFTGGSSWSMRARPNPRPETEQLVEWILQDASGTQGAPVSVLDIGTGSGAIIETLMLENPRVKGFAADISPDALAVAGKQCPTLWVAAIACH